MNNNKLTLKPFCCHRCGNIYWDYTDPRFLYIDPKSKVEYFLCLDCARAWNKFDTKWDANKVDFGYHTFRKGDDHGTV